MNYLNIIKSTKVQLLLIVFLTFLAYSNIFGNSFVFDDNRLIVGWPYHKSFSYVSALFGSEIPLNSQTWNYRPVRGIFFMFAYKLFEDIPLGYHFVSIAVHLGATILVYLIAGEILKTSYFKLRASSLKWLPFVTGLFLAFTQSILRQFLLLQPVLTTLAALLCFWRFIFI